MNYVCRKASLQLQYVQVNLTKIFHGVHRISCSLSVVGQQFTWEDDTQQAEMMMQMVLVQDYNYADGSQLANICRWKSLFLDLISIICVR